MIDTLFSRIKMYCYIHMVNPSISSIHNISKKYSKCLIGHEQGVIPGNVLLNSPNNPISSGLCCAAPEKLNPTKPNSKNSIKLQSFASCSPLEHNFGENLRWTMKRRVIVCKDWWFAICESKIMPKYEI